MGADRRIKCGTQAQILCPTLKATTYLSALPPSAYWGSLALWSSYFEFLFWSEFHFYFSALVSSGHFAIYLLNDTGVVLGCGVV